MPELSTITGWPRHARWLAPIGVALILLASYAYFRHARDWNSASRLMLMYSIVDRGTVRIDGLEVQTRDRAIVKGHSYSDKPPGYSLAATVPYAIAKRTLKLPDHPIGGSALRRWPGDYWATLGTAGLATAIGAALLVMLSGRIGCGPRASALVGLTYGLATPAYVYATMSYGHSLASTCLLGSLALIDRPGERRAGLALLSSGFLAASASVVELSVGPVSALLGIVLLVKVIAGRLPIRGIFTFGIGALVPTAVLLGYNALAFGDPLDIGYAHEVVKEFSDVHSPDNPLGLRAPEWGRAAPLLWGRYRGLCFYAPILMLAPIGWLALLAKRRFGLAFTSIFACIAVFMVNLSYPEWSGGWSTGPRLLVPLLPFGMLGVSGTLAVGGRVARALAAALAIGGGVLILLFQGVGAQIPQWWSDPLLEVVWPHWSGDRLSPGWVGGRFTRTIAADLPPGWVDDLGAAWQWLQFVPLVAFQAVAIAVLLIALGGRGRTQPGV